MTGLLLPADAPFCPSFFTPVEISLDAHGDILRGLQVVETSIGITSNMMGHKLEGKGVPILLYSVNLTKALPVSKDMSTEVQRLPLGVCAGLVYFFPSFPSCVLVRILQHHAI